MNRLQLHLVFAFLLFMVLPVALVAQGGSAPVIVSATIDYGGSPWQLAISGRNFKPSGIDPTIYFGDVKLTSLQFPSDASGVASLPSPNPKEGTYLLTVTNSKKVSGTAYLTIGAAGPPGDIDQPRAYKVYCDTGGSVSDALTQAGDGVAGLTISISGTCHEEVFINRDHVILTAADPNNPPTLTHDGTPVFVNRARDVSLSHLKITGPPSNNGVIVSNSQVTLEFCEISNKGLGVLMEGPSVVDIRNSRIHDNGGGISVGAGGVLTIYDTYVKENTGTGIGSNASTVHAVHSTISHNRGGMELWDGAAAILEQSDVSWNSPNEGIYSLGSSVHLTDSTLTYNGVAGIWVEGTSVMLAGGNTISNNTGGGIALFAGSSLAHRKWSGSNVISNNGNCGLTAIVSSFAIGEQGVMIDQSESCAIYCDTALAICDPADIVGSIDGCGLRCPDR